MIILNKFRLKNLKRILRIYKIPKKNFRNTEQEMNLSLMEDLTKRKDRFREHKLFMKFNNNLRLM